jgi:hypothetical protein
MIRLLHTSLILLMAVLTFATSAFAQRRTFRDRGFIAVNGGYQMSNHDFDQASTFQVNAEEGRFTTDYNIKSGPTFDVAGGVTVWRRLALGVAVTRFSSSTPSTLSGAVPHPFFFDRARAVNGDVAGLEREEVAVHVQARTTAPIGSRLQVTAFGGPSFFQVKQDMVTAFTWAESYPFDDARFGSATTVSAKGSQIGFNVGADVAYFFSRQVGVGGTIQFSGATVELDGAGGSQDVKAGGARGGAGLRLRF